MPGFGYPDWQRGTTNFAYPIVSDSSLATTAGTNFGTFYVGNWPNLSIGFNNHDAIALDTITLTWFDTNNAIVGTGTDLIVFGSHDNSSVIVPVKAPFVQVSIKANQNATASTQTLVYGTTSELTPLNTDGTNYHLASFSGAFAANQSVGPFVFGFWYTGWAQIAASSSAGAGANVVLRYLNPSNTANEFAHLTVYPNNSAVPQYVYIPPNTCTYTITNGGTAQSMTVVISPAPKY